MQKKEGTDKRELAKALGRPAAQVGYHLGVLHNADLIAYLADQQELQGKAARSYVAAASAKPRMVIGGEERYYRFAAAEDEK